MFSSQSRSKLRSETLVAFLLTGILIASTFVGIPAMAANSNPNSQSGNNTTNNCQLNSAKGNIQHVIYIQFDNTHFVRDNPNVPSDLEQMPNLLNFMNSSGVIYTNHHTPLISHTATDILTSLTGVYGDKMGVPVANIFRYFKPDNTTSTG